MYKTAILALLFVCGMGAAEAAPRIRFGGVMVGVGYSRYGGPWCCGYYPYGYGYGWSPYFYHPYYSSGFVSGPGMGEVKLRAPRKDAEVYLDGAFAGLASERKSIWLEPGVYNLEVRTDGRQTFARRIYVLSGKSLRINAQGEANR